MRQFFSILIFLFFLSASYSQTILPGFTDAKEEFRRLYYTEPLKMNETWSEHLRMTNEIFFSVYNGYAAKYFNDAVKGKSENDAKVVITSIADYLNSWFLETHALDSSKEYLESLKDLLPPMLDAICGCVTNKIKFKDSLPVGTELDLGNCLDAYYSDTRSALRIRLAFTGYNNVKIWRGTQAMALYLTSQCPAMYKFRKNTLNLDAIEHYLSSRGNYLEDIPNLITKLYNGNKTDSLKIIFPNYKQYESQINLLKQSHFDEWDQNTEVTADSIILTTTYWSAKNNKAHVDGQVILCMSNDLVPIAERFIFISREKIKNLAELGKNIYKRDMILPPPPPKGTDIVAPIKN